MKEQDGARADRRDKCGFMSSVDYQLSFAGQNAHLYFMKGSDSHACAGERWCWNMAVRDKIMQERFRWRPQKAKTGGSPILPTQELKRSWWHW